MNEPQPTETSLPELRDLVRGLAEEVRELRAQLGLLSTEVGWLKGRLAELSPQADLPRANGDSPPACLDAPRTPGDGPLWREGGSITRNDAVPTREGSAGAFGGRPASPSTLQALRNGEKLNNAIRQRLQAFSSDEADDGAVEIPTDVDVLIDRLHALADGPGPTSHPSPMSPERH